MRLGIRLDDPKLDQVVGTCILLLSSHFRRYITENWNKKLGMHW